jgi:hypothetical protein
VKGKMMKISAEGVAWILLVLVCVIGLLLDYYKA